jgi:hypothetical protein
VVRALVASLLIALLAQPAGAAQRDTVRVLTLSHALSTGDEARLQVQAGKLRRGEEISIRTESGALVGTIAPFGLRADQAAGTVSLPLRPQMFRNGRIVLKLTVRKFGVAPRPPSAGEVGAVALQIRRKPD